MEQIYRMETMIQNFPYIRRYLNSLRQRANIIVRGSRFSDKVRLMFFSLSDSIPRIFLRKFPLLKCYVGVIKENFVKGVMINFEGSRFYCIDVERACLFSHPILRVGCGNIYTV